MTTLNLTDFGPDSGGRVKVAIHGNILELYFLISIRIAGTNHSQTDRLRKRSPFVWQKTGRGRAHASMERLHQAVQQRGHVIVREKGPLQTARKLRQSKPNPDQTAVRSHRNRMG